MYPIRTQIDGSVYVDVSSELKVLSEIIENLENVYIALEAVIDRHTKKPSSF